MHHAGYEVYGVMLKLWSEPGQHLSAQGAAAVLVLAARLAPELEHHTVHLIAGMVHQGRGHGTVHTPAHGHEHPGRWPEGDLAQRPFQDLLHGLKV